jgi:2-amino-4-hydroxy-6-hydroxymethyldihydropteridine diphosphokinase
VRSGSPNLSAWRSNAAEMNKSHLAYLSLGSNIQPEKHLVRTIQLLQEQVQIEMISSAWESVSVGADGPNYLNACLSLITHLSQAELKEQILLSIELQLGRKRSENKFAPRTMDIDIVIFDGQPCNDRYWEQAFVVIPLAQIHPTFQNPLTGEPIPETAARLRKEFWIRERREVLSRFRGINPTDQI